MNTFMNFAILCIAINIDATPLSEGTIIFIMIITVIIVHGVYIHASHILMRYNTPCNSKCIVPRYNYIYACLYTRGVDTFQKVRGLKGAVPRITRGKLFCDHAHIGDKSRRLWIIN